MASLRHNNPSETGLHDRPGSPSEPSPRDGYLDAARDCILEVGWRRTTLTEVARRSGVSRMTIYRTWSDMPRLLGDLMTREWTGVVEAAVSGATEGTEPDSLERLVAQVVATIRELRENELFVRIVEVDPELILPYLFARRGRSQDLVLAMTEQAIRDGQRAGTIRAADPRALARTLLLAGHGFVFSGHTVVDDHLSEEQLHAELADLLTRALKP